MSPATRIEVLANDDGVRTRLVQGAMAARRLRSGTPASTAAVADTVRIALVAASALLLAEDKVRIEIVVDGPVHVEVLETAGTVAYDMRGASARWDVAISLRGGAALVWDGAPFVISSGASVDRSTTLDLDEGSRAAMRESQVFGRTGQAGGSLRTRTRATLSGLPLLVEDLDLSLASRHGWATTGTARCLQTVSTYGVRLPEATQTLQADASGSTVRVLSERLHLSRTDEAWADAIQAVTRKPARAR